jgi:NAD(P)-dependent dehydrogenase (short-subunit alcohol dehydrogenase family)
LYPLKCDVSKESDVKEAFKWIKAKVGGVDILVNNSGVATFSSLIGIQSVSKGMGQTAGAYRGV